MPVIRRCCLIILQTYVLDEGAKHHRDSWWWVKADGCDLSGLAESTRVFGVEIWMSMMVL